MKSSLIVTAVIVMVEILKVMKLVIMTVVIVKVVIVMEVTVVIVTDVTVVIVTVVIVTVVIFTSISKNNLTPQHPHDVFRAPFCNLAMFCTIDPNRFISDNNNSLSLTLELVKQLFLL